MLKILVIWWVYINNSEKLEERPINLEDVRDKFIAYSDN